VKAALHEVMYAETREQAREAIARLATEYGAKYPKAVTTLEKDADVLLTFFDFPAEHGSTSGPRTSSSPRSRRCGCGSA
jgi:putative transposase